MSSRKETESFSFVHTTQYIYEEDKKSALVRLGRQATFKFRALWSVRDGKELIVSWQFIILLLKELDIMCMTVNNAHLILIADS